MEWTLGALAAARVAIKRDLRKALLDPESTVHKRRNLEDAYEMLKQIERETFGRTSKFPQ